MKTTFSRRELYALGEPIGDSATVSKVGGGRIYGMGGGGGGTTQSTGTTYNTNIPEYARPYVETMLSATQQQLFTGPDGKPLEKNAEGYYDIGGFKPYQAYSKNPADYVAPFSPMQQNAQQSIASLQTPGSYGQAMDVTGMGILGAADTAQQAQGLMGMGQRASMAGNQYARQATNPYATQAYMSPYMQNVVDVQQQEAMRQSGMQALGDRAQAVKAGAFGGSRQGLVEAERQRNLATQLGQIQATGLQSAFDKAQANQQFAANLGLQGQQTGASIMGQGIGAQQAAYNQAMQGAQQYANLGNQAQQAQINVANLQNQYGAQQQAAEQQKINQAIQDWSNTQQYPLMQLGVMSNMLRGLPMQASTTNQYVAAPNALTQGIGAAGSAASLYNAFKGGAEGGLPKEFKYASGGIASIPRYEVGGEVKDQLRGMSVEQLQKEASSSSSPTIRAMAKEILAEKQMTQAEAAKGVGPTGPMGVQYEAPPVQAAQGGILAFKEPNEDNNYGVTDSGSMDGMQLAGITEADVRKAYGDWQATMPGPLSRQTVTGSGKENAARSNYEKVLQEYQSQRDTSQPGAAAPVSPTAEKVAVEAAAERVPKQDRGIPQAVPRAESARPQLSTERATGPEQERLAAIYEAQRKAKAATPATPTAPAKDRTGIMAATPAPAKPTAPAVPVAKEEDALAGLNKEVADTRKEADRSLEDFYKEQQAMREKLGLGEDKSAQEYRQKIMEERANSKDEAERQRWMRSAQFFAAWGSTPGSTLAAGLNALQKTMPDIISDEKDRKKANRELDKVMYDIDHAIRLEKKGDMDAAVKAKEKAAERAEKLNERLYAYKQGVDVANINKEAHMASAAATRESTAEYKRATNINTAFGRYQAAGNELERVRHAIETENAKDDAYTRAQRTIATYNSVEKPDASLTKMYEAAQGVIAAKDAKNLPRIQAAEKDVQSAYKHYTNMGGGDVKGPSATPAPANTTMTMADVEATAKKSGKTVDEVKAAAKAKGYTIK